MTTARDSDSASSQSPQDSLERRVAALEHERELLMKRYARQLEFGNERLRTLLGDRPDPAPPPGPAITTATPSTAIPDMTAGAAPDIASAPATLARVLARVERELEDVDRLAAAGDSATATEAAMQVTRQSTAALRATLADAELREALVTMIRDIAPPPVPMIRDYLVAAGGDKPVSFPEAEIAVLQMSGLHRSLAAKHVEAAISEYEQLPPVQRAVTLHQVLDQIAAAERSVAYAATVLPIVINQPPQRLKWRRLVTYGLGGTLIVAANAGAVVLLGPVAAAVSAAVGSATLGAAAAPLVM
jgi:hypothetical protein